MDLRESVVESRRVYEGRVINLRVDSVRLPDGRESTREIVEHRGAVAVVPLLPSGEVLLVRQFRLAAGGPLLEIPAGTRDPGEPIEACALREVEEEVGYRPGKMQRLFSAFVAPGYSTEEIHFYLATDLEQTRQATDDDELVEVVALPLSEAVSRAAAGELRDAKTIAGLLAAARCVGLLRPDEAE